MCFTVYRHINRLNGKSYIGWTSKSIDYRWNQHCRLAQNASPLVFHSAISKYGPDQFDHEILEICESEKEAAAAEIRLIKEYKTHYIDGFGYNMTLGGDGVSGIIIDKESYKRVSEALKGNQHTKGRIRPESEKRKIAAGHRKLTVSDLSNIRMLSASGVDSHSLAKQFNCSYVTIRRVLRGAYRI